MPDPRLATRKLPDGVTAIPEWGFVLRSSDGKHRDRMKLTWTSWLRRINPPTLIIGMNPSGGGDNDADATLIKNWEFSRRWTNGPMIMMNVNPTRATNPKDMRFDPQTSQFNRSLIRDVAGSITGSGGKVVVMWGNPPLPKEKLKLFLDDAKAICDQFQEIGVVPLCLGHNENRSPTHSLMLSYGTPLVPYSP